MDPEKEDFDIDAGVATIAEGLGIEAPEDEPIAEVDPQAPIEQAEPAPTARVAPKSWGKDTHEIWTQLPPAAQEQIERREKQMLEGLEQYKGDAGMGRQMREITTPYKALLASQGVDEGKAVSVLLNAHYKLSTLPAESRAQYFASLAQTYGIDLGALPARAQAQEAPEVRAMRERLEKLEGSMTQKEHVAYEQAKQRTSAEVNTFAAANPYFDEVADDIVAYINAGLGLKEAYDRAVWANPVTRTKESARLQQESEKQLREKAKREAEAAKKASGANVRSRDTRRAPTEPLGKMDDTLKDTLTTIRSRAH
jgi:valyl-tRNA synthetase